MKHELKLNQDYSEDIINRIKTFEIRKNDKDFHQGDWLLLRETNDVLEYTGLEIMVRILLVRPCKFLIEGYVILYLDMDNFFYYTVN